jgi:hypothetical protein
MGLSNKKETADMCHLPESKEQKKPNPKEHKPHASASTNLRTSTTTRNGTSQNFGHC